METAAVSGSGEISACAVQHQPVHRNLAQACSSRMLNDGSRGSLTQPSGFCLSCPLEALACRDCFKTEELPYRHIQAHAVPPDSPSISAAELEVKLGPQSHGSQDASTCRKSISMQ